MIVHNIACTTQVTEKGVVVKFLDYSGTISSTHLGQRNVTLKCGQQVSFTPLSNAKLTCPLRTCIQGDLSSCLWNKLVTIFYS